MSVLKPSDVRRSFSPEFKWQVVQESKARLLSASALARKYDVNTNQLFRWVRDAQAEKASHWSGAWRESTTSGSAGPENQRGFYARQTA